MTCYESRTLALAYLRRTFYDALYAPSSGVVTDRRFELTAQLTDLCQAVTANQFVLAST